MAYAHWIGKEGRATSNYNSIHHIFTTRSIAYGSFFFNLETVGHYRDHYKKGHAQVSYATN